jgi:hypothetical protein
VDAAETLRSAIHGQESERGPLAEALFPAWRGPSLRRHADQALAAEAELQRRLSSSYVARRLEEAATATALRPALEALDAAGTAWAAEPDRPALTGTEAEEVRARLLALAGETAHTLDRVRWVARAALVERPDLAHAVFRGARARPRPRHRSGRATPSSRLPERGHPRGSRAEATAAAAGVPGRRDRLGERSRGRCARSPDRHIRGERGAAPKHSRPQRQANGESAAGATELTMALSPLPIDPSSHPWWRR